MSLELCFVLKSTGATVREGQLFLAIGNSSVCSRLGATLPGSCKRKQPHSRGFQVLSLALDASARLPF